MASSPTVLIAAASGRALAMSARRAGYAPLVVDCFGDQDTIANADAHRRVSSAGGRGMQANDIFTALDALAAGRDPLGVVCGTGFEDRPDLLACIAQRWRLIGNDANTVAQIKNPLALAALCDRGRIPHPDTSTDPPQVPTGWLAKRIGGAGGSHIRLDGYAVPAPADFYYQRRVDGTPVSALVLANGHSAMILGFSTQWSSPAPQRPFRYGGAARPAELAPEIADALAAAVRRLAALVPLVGLNSVDFLVEAPAFHLVEINPRPGATIDIFEFASQRLSFRAPCGGLSRQTPGKDAMLRRSSRWRDRLRRGRHCGDAVLGMA